MSKIKGAGGLMTPAPFFSPFSGPGSGLPVLPILDKPAAGGNWGSPAGKMSDVHHRVQHAVKDIMHTMIDITLAQPALFDF